MGPYVTLGKQLPDQSEVSQVLMQHTHYSEWSATPTWWYRALVVLNLKAKLGKSKGPPQNSFNHRLENQGRKKPIQRAHQKPNYLRSSIVHECTVLKQNNENFLYLYFMLLEFLRDICCTCSFYSPYLKCLFVFPPSYFALYPCFIYLFMCNLNYPSVL